MISALYIHIPFCKSKCNYCSFSSYCGLEAIHERYTNCLVKELQDKAKHYGERVRLSTIFFGGGTPTVLGGGQLEKILAACKNNFRLDDTLEISVEVNPGTVDTQRLCDLYNAGFNRLSIGVQSFIDSELQFLGRCHTASEAIATVASAKAAGFLNWSIDLMYGIPGQSLDDWKYNLETGLSLQPKHLSLYQLSFEEGTPLYHRKKKGYIEELGDETVLSMDKYNQEATLHAGSKRYEISNYCQPGYECRHNVTYWHNKDYLAVGAAAVSFIAGFREQRVQDPALYCDLIEKRKDVVAYREQLGLEASFRETVMMGMRMTEGISPKELAERFGIDLQQYYGKILIPLLTAGFVEFTPTRFRATQKGRLVLNSVLAELI
ncbi:radical SAM family heme chaperone HemW [Desulfopila sp. IMCC35008]|uniref:radical SAM family heme chaperone HemW n=1 Tax=Desulfopila sp. IMCC35008 TaxID=2653858 RepID=UPI0013D3B3FA|nr:radical SAM family heme chaperone HemW [Desulfopila sp. IMCC35008]